MSQTLREIAQKLKESNKKAQLIYAFNGSGKTRLSREFKDLIDPKMDEEETEDRDIKVLYYNAFTEDLFYWDNDLEGDTHHKLIIRPNKYTQWMLGEQGQDQNAIKHFQQYTSDRLTPYFSADFSEVTFSFARGNDKITKNIKISKGEESNFIWSIFYSLLEQIIDVLNEQEEENSPYGMITDIKIVESECKTDRYNQLKYVFIDDPVSSLDENHLIELAVNLAALVKKAPQQIKFIITTHSPLFYNVLHNELGLNKQGKKEGCYLLERLEDGNYHLNVKYGDTNKSFSYHLHLKCVLQEAVDSNSVERYHFTLLRNLYEKTSGFLGYARWSDLLDTVEGNKDSYVRLINTLTHSMLSSEQVREPSPAEKKTVRLLLDNLLNNYAYWQGGEQNG